MKRTLFIWFMLLFPLLFLGEGAGMRCFAQFLGGNTDGHSLVSKTDVAVCTLPAYLISTVGTGGNADGHSLVSKTDVAVCTLPTYLTSTVGIGGNADGHSLVSKTDVAICTLPAYLTFVVGTGGSGDGFSRLGASACLDVLPIELLYFTATQINKKILCEWKTISEINSDYFTVERSTNTKDIEIIGTQRGAGNSTTTLYYSLIDPNPEQGISYYRLKQTDHDGKYQYADWVAVNLNGIDLISISPNPSQDEFEYIISSSEITNVQINAVDVLGRKIIEQILSINKGINKLNMDITKLSAGVYVLQITTESGLYKTHKHFVKN